MKNEDKTPKDKKVEKSENQVTEEKKQPKIDYTKRVIEKVPPINRKIPKRGELFKNGKPDMTFLAKHFKQEGKLDNKHVIEIAQKARKIMQKEPNVLMLKDPINVCGDIHGQFYDLMTLFELGGNPKDISYLFLGDYVDRGNFGMEVVIWLLSYKINYPEKVYMLRGNHECRHLSAYFNFLDECCYKYSEGVYVELMKTFDHLPLCAVVNEKFFCVHGGLSPEIKYVDDINFIKRFREPPSEGPMCDLLWADPMDEDNEEEEDVTFISNDQRGCSYSYSYTAVMEFLQNNDLLCVIRAHEAQDEGYRLFKNGKETQFPSVISIFSAPNYCDVYNNKGAIINFFEEEMNIKQFNSVAHPYYLPKFMNAFTWSLPFVSEKTAEIFKILLKACEQQDEDDVSIDSERGDIIRAKIMSGGKRARVYTTLRQERESITVLKGLAGGNIPEGILSQGPKAIKKAVSNFEGAKKVDKNNEKMPSKESKPKIHTKKKFEGKINFWKMSKQNFTTPTITISKKNKK